MNPFTPHEFRQRITKQISPDSNDSVLGAAKAESGNAPIPSHSGMGDTLTSPQIPERSQSTTGSVSEKEKMEANEWRWAQQNEDQAAWEQELEREFQQRTLQQQTDDPYYK